MLDVLRLQEAVDVMQRIVSKIDYYKCNSKTLAALKEIVPNKVVLPTEVMVGVEIRVFEDCEDGLHPVYRTAK